MSKCASQHQSDILSQKLGVIQETAEDLVQRNAKTEELLLTLSDRLQDINARLDAKIDMQDATRILELRQEAERFVRSEMIQSISKLIMPAIDILKDLPQQDEMNLAKTISDLDQRCKQAGLIPLDRLF